MVIHYLFDLIFKQNFTSGHDRPKLYVHIGVFNTTGLQAQ